MTGNETRSKIAVCPDCGIEQELFLFRGHFWDYQNPVQDRETKLDRPRLRFRNVYICAQCAQEAHGGHFVQN